MRNAFTVDLEDWYCAGVFEHAIPFKSWSRCTSRVAIGTWWLLDLLERYRIEATFFMLGYVAEREPELVEEIVDRGHEVASHGYAHQRLDRMSPDAFAADLDRASETIERSSGVRPRGYRAPEFSMRAPNVDWATDVLRERGFAYSSSVLPTCLQPGRGIAGASLVPYRHRSGLLEVPLSCALVGGVRFPAAGGGYLRQLPFPLTRALWRRCNAQGRPVIFHIHPWELDSVVPAISLPPWHRVRQERNIGAMRARVERLVAEFPFTSIRNLIDVDGDGCSSFASRMAER